eukprot:388580_1
MAVHKRSLLLVSGFVRESESILPTASINIIPVSLIQICYKFYLNSISKFIQYSSVSSDINHNRYIGQNKFASLNISNKIINTKNIITINGGITNHSIQNKNHDLLKLLTPPYVYIPNISWSLPSPDLLCKKRNFDAILGLYTDELNFDYRPLLILFNSSEIIDDYESEMYFSTFLSTKPFPSCTQSVQYLYCGPKHGIISQESDGKLYQLNCQDIASNDFRFKALSDENKSDFATLEWYLKMVYLQRPEKIFAVNSEKSNMSINKVTCGIYDLNESKWKHDFKWKFIDINTNDCGICCHCNEDDIYFVSMSRSTAKYDMIKEKWILLKSADQFDKYMISPTIWFDNDHINNLYCIGPIAKNVDDDENKIQLKCFDIRDNKKTWHCIDKIYPYDGIKFCKSIF